MKQPTPFDAGHRTRLPCHGRRAGPATNRDLHRVGRHHPGSRRGRHRHLVCSAYERGTYGKLLIEHAALRIAAKRDVARVLYDTGSAALADEFLATCPTCADSSTAWTNSPEASTPWGSPPRWSSPGPLVNSPPFCVLTSTPNRPEFCPESRRRSAITELIFTASVGYAITHRHTPPREVAGTPGSRSWSVSKPATTTYAGSRGRQCTHGRPQGGRLARPGVMTAMVASPERPRASGARRGCRPLSAAHRRRRWCGRLVGHWLAWPLITSTVGPTAYMFAAHPRVGDLPVSQRAHRA